MVYLACVLQIMLRVVDVPLWATAAMFNPRNDFCFRLFVVGGRVFLQKASVGFVGFGIIWPMPGPKGAGRPVVALEGTLLPSVRPRLPPWQVLAPKVDARLRATVWVVTSVGFHRADPVIVSKELDECSYHCGI